MAARPWKFESSLGHHFNRNYTDTAPHFIHDKESECGCAGVFNASYCLSILAQIFDNERSMDKLENFVSKNGAKHYNLETNNEKIILKKSKEKLIFKKFLNVNDKTIKIFEPDFPVFWDIKV